MKKMNKKVLVAALLIVSTVIACFAVLDFGAQAQVEPLESVTVSIQEPSQNVMPCQDFAVDVFVSGITSPPLDAFDIIVWFDPTLVNVLSIDPGSFVPVGDAGLWWSLVNNLVGYVHFGTTPVNDVSVTGSGVVAHIEFHCEGVGDALIAFDAGSTLIDPGAAKIPAEWIQGLAIQQYPTAHVYIDPPTYTVPICVPFTVDVKVTGVSNLAEYWIAISYDTASLDCIDIVDACFLPEPKSQVFKTIDDPTGLIDFRYQSGADLGVYGDGTLARITFHCTGAGESILSIDLISLWDPGGFPIPKTTADGRIIQHAYWEPVKLQHIVEWPGLFTYWDIPFPWPPATADGYLEVMAELEAKGFMFDPISYPETATAMAVEGSIEGEAFSGAVTSLWSNDTLEDGTRACMLSAEMDDGTSMAMAFVTNLLPPEQVPEVDPYIIVNAQPYIFVDFYWYAWPDPTYPLGRIVTWSYWWYDSHSHPNWFWSPYWWWRCYTKGYYNGIPYPPTDINWAYWRPWWGWWWHWIYWRHWYWWSTYFPYDP